MAHMVFCTKFKAEMEGLDEPPFDSDFGNKIYKSVSKKAWGEWLERQKMLLNEYRLQPWTREAQEFLVEQDERVLLRRRRLPAQGICRTHPLKSTGGEPFLGPPRVHWYLQATPAVCARTIGRDETSATQSGRGSAW